MYRPCSPLSDGQKTYFVFSQKACPLLAGQSVIDIEGTGGTIYLTSSRKYISKKTVHFLLSVHLYHKEIELRYPQTTDNIF